MPGQGSASASLSALKSEAQSNYGKCKASLESLKEASRRLQHRKRENALFCLSEKYVECRRARNIALETGDEDLALLSARKTKLLADEASSLTLEKMARFGCGKDSLLRFALKNSFDAGQVKAIENFFADFMPEGEGIIVARGKTSGVCQFSEGDADGLAKGQGDRKTRASAITVYRDFVPWLGKYDSGDIWLRDIWVLLGKGPDSIVMQNTAFPPVSPEGRVHPENLSCLTVSGVRLKGGALPVDKFELDTGGLGLGEGQILGARYLGDSGAYCFNLLDRFAIDIPGDMVRAPEGGAVAHFARMAGQCGYDFGRLVSVLSEEGLTLEFPAGDPRGPALVSANLSGCSADSFQFSLFGCMHEGKPVISTEVQATIVHDGESVWTAGFSFPKKQFFVREFWENAKDSQTYLHWSISKEMVGRSTG